MNYFIMNTIKSCFLILAVFLLLFPSNIQAETSNIEEKIFVKLAQDAIANEQYLSAMRIALHGLKKLDKKHSLNSKWTKELNLLLKNASVKSTALFKYKTKGYQINNVNFHPTKNKLVLAGSDGIARILDFQGKLIIEINAHKKSILYAEFSSDGKMLVTASADNTSIVWTIDGKKIVTLSGHKKSIWQANFSCDSEKVITMSANGMVKIWKIDGEEIGSTDSTPLNLWGIVAGHSKLISDLQFSPDCKSFLLAAENYAMLYSIEGKLLHRLSGHTDYVTSVKFSPDGKFIVTASKDQTSKLWNHEGHLLSTFEGHSDAVNSAIFNQDSTKILTRSKDRSVRLWELGGRLLQVYSGHLDEVTQASYFNNGTNIFTVSQDKSIKFWSLNGKLVSTFHGHEYGIIDGRFDPKEKYFYTLSRNTDFQIGSELILRKKNPLLIGTYKGTVKRLAKRGLENGNAGQLLSSINSDFNHDEKNVFLQYNGVNEHGPKSTIGDGLFFSELMIWETTTGKQSAYFKSRRGNDNKLKKFFTKAFINPKKNKIAAFGLDYIIDIISLNGEKLNSLKGHQGKINNIDFNSDGSLLVSASEDKTAIVWSGDGKLLAKLVGHKKGVTKALFSPDGKRIITIAKDNTCKIWKLDGKIIKTVPEKTYSADLRISPDSKYFLIQKYREVSVWTMEGELYKKLALPTKPKEFSYGVYNSAYFSPDSKKVITSSQGGGIIWDLNGNSKSFLINKTGLQSFDEIIKNRDFKKGKYSSDGRWIVAITRDNNISIWNSRGDYQTSLQGHEKIIEVKFDQDATKLLLVFDDFSIHILDIRWITHWKGMALKQRVCQEKLNGAELFTKKESKEPLLEGLEGVSVCQ